MTAYCRPVISQINREFFITFSQSTSPLGVPCPNTTIMFGKQEAQLSQTDRATLRVIEYFVKSLEVIRNDTVE